MMSLTLDSEIAAVLAASEAAIPLTPRGDAHALREVTNTTLAAIDETEPASPNVVAEDHHIEVSGDTVLLARWYSRKGTTPGSAVVYLHGGGMVCGSVDLYDKLVAKYVEETGVPFLSVDYRLAPEFSGTTLVDDGYAALTWLHEHAERLGVDPNRIAIMGDSGGGGVAAGVAIAARDAGTPLAKQILIYPMLDDRNLTPDPEIAPFASWTYDNNYTGWHALLGESIGAEEVSPLVAPARLEDFRGLAPAFIDVGDLDIFRDEDIRYSLRLLEAGVACELHVRAGCLHAFDRFAPSARVAAASWFDRYRVIKSL